MTEPQLKPLASRDNPFVKRLHALAHSARERRKLDETVLEGQFEYSLRDSLLYTIGGGTNEIQRTLIALRGLGLPR